MWVLWNEVLRTVTDCFATYVFCITFGSFESRSLGWERKLDGILHLKLNIFSSPIANKYREGKMQSTLKRGLHAPETTVLQALGSFTYSGFAFLRSRLNLAFQSMLLKYIWFSQMRLLLELSVCACVCAKSTSVIVAYSCHDPEEKCDCACVEHFLSCSARYVRFTALAPRSSKWPVLKHGPRSPHMYASACLR